MSLMKRAWSNRNVFGKDVEGMNSCWKKNSDGKRLGPTTTKVTLAPTGEFRFTWTPQVYGHAENNRRGLVDCGAVFLKRDTWI